MAPPMPNPTKRMTAQPSRPVQRYRPGKAVHEEESSDEDSEEEEVKAPPPKKAPTTRPQPQKPTPQNTEHEDSDEEGFVTDEDEDEDDGGVNLPAVKATDPTKPVATFQRPFAPAGDPQSEDEESEGESEESEDESSASDASSESEAPTRKFQRPTFIKKSDRNNSATETPAPHQPTPSAASATPAPSEEIKARRLAETDFLISEKINRDNIARAAGRRAWDDDDALDPSALVDDTDGLDPEAEHAAWRLRELQRLKRAREALIAREKELEEVERRRNLSAAEREAEDKAHLDAQRAEKDSKGQSGFLARYHHKGAFFQDSAEAEELKKRDVMGARFEDEVGDKSVLPEYMRVRDMNKLGKKGRTRYTDLRAEDTGGFANDVKRWKGAMGGGGGQRDQNGMDMSGVDARFLPDDDRRAGGPMSSGANNAPLGQRRERPRSRSSSRSPRRNERDSYRPTRRKSYSRSRSRSASPPRRKRSRSRERYRDDDKRRRVEAS